MKVTLLFCMSALPLVVNANELSVEEPVEILDKLAVEGSVYPQSTVKLLPESSSILQDTADVLKKNAWGLCQ